MVKHNNILQYPTQKTLAKKCKNMAKLDAKTEDLHLVEPAAASALRHLDKLISTVRCQTITYSHRHRLENDLRSTKSDQ